MAYTIINNFIPESLYPLKAPYTMIPEYVTIHNTANDATAVNEAQYVHNNPANTSYHVAIDDKNAVQIIRFSRNGFHAGDGATGTGNRKSIGIEICYSKSGGQKYVDSEANAIEYIAHVLKQYRWGVDRVRWHRDWSGKNCPHRIFAEGRAQSVKDRIAARLAGLNGDKPVVKPANKPAAKPVPKKNTITLPKSAKTWRTYKTNVQPVKANSDWSLTPSAFGGITYEVLGRPYANVVTVNTSRGKRNIFVGPGTGAVIK